jgi:hypothetical protein
MGSSSPFYLPAMWGTSIVEPSSEPSLSAKIYFRIQAVSFKYVHLISKVLWNVCFTKVLNCSANPVHSFSVSRLLLCM